ncbi:hypothetical protein D1614_05625 [Maribellus luteus]|uniref:Uncharacterized protein n=1 Tax=Maribellus luteus TaxID=2305463 RepID=A0A399T4D4_9BACT|nr:hypothetical protein D1614_05625 [Maribellus luteus]
MQKESTSITFALKLKIDFSESCDICTSQTTPIVRIKNPGSSRRCRKIIHKQKQKTPNGFRSMQKSKGRKNRPLMLK